MKIQLRLFLASALLCLMFSFSAMAGDTPISNITDGDTPISNITVSDQTVSNGNSVYEFTSQIAGDLLNFILSL